MQVARYTKVVLTIIAAGLWTLILIAALSPQPAMAGISFASVETEQHQARGARSTPLYIDFTCHGC